MATKLWVPLLCSCSSGFRCPPSSFPPGYVDPAPLLAAAAKEIGEAELQVRHVFRHRLQRRGRPDLRACDQHRLAADRSDGQLHADHQLGNRDEQGNLRSQARPESRRRGSTGSAGSTGRRPRRTSGRRTSTNGKYSWSIDGDGPPVAVPPEDAERYQLDLWMNPPGFLKAARMPGANPRAFWRWEQIEKGRDGNVVAPEKMHVVAITVLGKYRMDATINQQNQIQRIKTTVAENALGDFNIEQESTDQMTFGNVKWPIAWHSHQGWDDNWQFDSESTGHNAYGGKFPKVQPNVCADPVPVPESVQAGAVPDHGHRRQAGKRRLPAGWRTREQLHGRVQAISSPCSRRRQRGAQPGGHRADRQAGAQQANPLAGQLASAFRSHRRDPHLHPHRRDHRSCT